MRSFTIVARAESGQGKSHRIARTVYERLKNHGAACQLLITSPEQTLRELVERSLHQHAEIQQKDWCLVICGGDGAIQEAINAVMAQPTSQLLLGLAPAGTCNDFAHGLALSPAPEEIVNVLLNGVPHAIDLGLAGEKHFCTIATVGLESTVNRFLRDHKTYSPRRWLFVLTAAWQLMILKAVQLQVTIDGEAQEASILNLVAANTRSYGGRVRIAPLANPTDGRLDLLMIQSRSRLSRMFTLLDALRGRHLNRREVFYQPVKRVKIESRQPYEVWADGEPLGTTPIEISVVPAALRILRPS